MAEQMHVGMILASQYKLVGKLSAGGMGVVCKAEDVELGTPVALKFISSKLAANKLAVERLKREATIGQQLAHRNICRLYGLHSHNDTRFIVMECVRGQTLGHFLANRLENKMTWEELRPIAAQIAEALDYAHNVVYTDGTGRRVRGVLHRDIKPSNVMISPEGLVKLVDFGIAREMKDNMTRVTGQETPGTLLYMSPEQYSGKQLTAASDIYSFAATLYESLAGHPPFHQGSVKHQLLNEQPEPIPGVSRHINAALGAALGKKPQLRPSTATQLVRLMSGERSRRSLLPWAAGLLVVFSIAAWFGLFGDRISGPLRHTTTSIKNWIVADPQVKTGASKKASAALRAGRADDGAAAALKAKAHKARSAAEKARLAAQTAGVDTLAPDLWRAGEESLAKANQAFDNDDPARAAENYPRTAKAYKDGVAKAGHMAHAAMRSAEASRDTALKIRAEECVPDIYAPANSEDDEGTKAFDAGRFADAREHWLKAANGYTKARRIGQSLANSERDKYERAVGAAKAVMPLIATFGGEAFGRMQDKEQRAKVSLEPQDPGTNEDLKEARDCYREALKLFEEARDTAGVKLAKIIADGRRRYNARDYKHAMQAAVEVLSFRPNHGDSFFKESFDGAAKLKRDVEANAPYESAMELKAGGRLVLCVACSPGGERIAAGCFDNNIRLWKLDGGTPCGEISPGHAEPQIACIDFSPDGKQVVSASWGDTLVVSDLETGAAVRLSGSDPHKAQVSSASFSGCGRYVVSGSYDATIKIWAAREKKLISTLNGSGGRVRSVAFSPGKHPDGKPTFVLSGSFDGNIKAWDAEKGSCVWTGTGHSAAVNDVAFSLDGGLIASAGRDNTVLIWKWNGKAGEQLARLEGHTEDVESVAFSPDGGRLVSAGGDGTIRIWDIAAARGIAKREDYCIQCLQYDPENDTEVLSVTFSPDGRFIIAAGRDTVKVWAQEACAAALHGR